MTTSGLPPRLHAGRMTPMCAERADPTVMVPRGPAAAALRGDRRAVARDPLGASNQPAPGAAPPDLGRLGAAGAGYRTAIELTPTAPRLRQPPGITLLPRDEPAAALADLERAPDPVLRDNPLPFVPDTLGRAQDADRQTAVFELRRALLAHGVGTIPSRSRHASAASVSRGASQAEPRQT